MGRASPARTTPASRREVDDVTLRRAQQGERSALDQVVERYHPMVHALVWRMACAQGESHVADLVQDALIRVIQNLARFDPAGPARLSTWILTIATRIVLNDRRRRDAPRIEPAGYIDPATVAAERELGAAIAAAVVELPEPQRILVSAVLPLVRRVAARVIGRGFRPEHVSPQVRGATTHPFGDSAD